MYVCSLLKRAASRIVLVTVVMIFLVATANAYTIVMRSGRRVEIPSHFVVTPMTLTYEVSPGFQVTLQMKAIDIPATERANNEAPGSLFSRLLSVSAATSTTSQVEETLTARRTITNRDLEPASHRRRLSEIAYAKRLKELNLPPLDQSRHQAELEAEEIRQELRESQLSKAEAESFWRGRAGELRAEMAVLDAEIGFIRARIGEYPDPNTVTSFTSVYSGYPWVTLGDQRRERRGRGWRNRRQSRGAYPPWGLPDPNTVGGFPNGTVLGIGQPAYDYSYERSALVTRLNELGAARVGLNARWRALEEEARRAGVPPGWLRE